MSAPYENWLSLGKSECGTPASKNKSSSTGREGTQMKKETEALEEESALLTGKGLDVYASMPPEQTNNYDVLKKTVLYSYQLTTDGSKIVPGGQT